MDLDSAVAAAADADSLCVYTLTRLVLTKTYVGTVIYYSLFNPHSQRDAL